MKGEHAFSSGKVVDKQWKKEWTEGLAAASAVVGDQHVGLCRERVVSCRVSLPELNKESSMPASHVNDVSHWRDRAAEMRALSEMMTNVEATAIMLRLADDYDLLADRAAARAGHDVNTPSPRS